jgi:hypothetical protein
MTRWQKVRFGLGVKPREEGNHIAIGPIPLWSHRLQKAEYWGSCSL